MKKQIISRVIKRTGEAMPFDKSRITNAIFRAAQAVGGSDRRKASALADKVIEFISFPGKTTTIVEEIQDAVEKVLIEEGHAKTAKVFILYRDRRRRERQYKENIIGIKVKTGLSINSLVLLKERYLLKDKTGKPKETPDKMFWRVAKNVAKADKKYSKRADLSKTEKEFHDTMAELSFLPNTPALMNAGTELQQLLSCFSLPVPDSIGGIFGTIRTAALIQQSGAGTGFSFSGLRPKNDIIESTMGTSSGPVSFMRMFDSSTEIIKMGGKRRGANMGILKVDHPDILEFINVKDDSEVLTNFNISVAVTDDFMKAVEKDGRYWLINPRTGKNVSKIKAREIFRQIAFQACKNGDPGMLFIDTINKGNPTPELGEFRATDSCAAHPLLDNEAAGLGSINLANMVKEGRIDYPKLRSTARTGAHFLDNVIDVTKYPSNEIKSISIANRKIGLGVMGFADMLFQLKVSYNSERAVGLADKVMKTVGEEARKMSEHLAAKRGAFQNFSKSIFKNKNKRRNATLTTISPTGSRSIIADVSPSIEPNFSLCFTRNILGQSLFYVNRYFEAIARENGFYSEELLEKIKNRASVQDIEEIPKNLRKIFVLAHDIKPEWNVKIQAAFQRHVDNAVSKTVNFRAGATPKDVEKVFMLAYKSGCKGITAYRQGSRETEILELESD